jgi:PAS domain S-box-containing protein
MYVADDVISIRWTADWQGRILSFSPDWTRYTGVANTDVCGRSDAWIDLVHPDDQSLVMAMWSARSFAADRYAVEFRLLGQDGIFRLFRGVAIPTRDGAEVSSWAGYCEPVAAR